MQKLLLILRFYRPFMVWSFIATGVTLFFNSHIIPVILTKLVLLVFLWFFINETSHRQKLILFKNLRLSPRRLYITIFLFDSVLTIMFMAMVGEYI
jgi:hypothetical protein